jgi:hypothetical protein
MSKTYEVGMTVKLSFMHVNITQFSSGPYITYPETISTLISVISLLPFTEEKIKN